MFLFVPDFCASMVVTFPPSYSTYLRQGFSKGGPREGFSPLASWESASSLPPPSCPPSSAPPKETLAPSFYFLSSSRFVFSGVRGVRIWKRGGGDDKVKKSCNNGMSMTRWEKRESHRSVKQAPPQMAGLGQLRGGSRWYVRLVKK